MILIGFLITLTILLGASGVYLHLNKKNKNVLISEDSVDISKWEKIYDFVFQKYKPEIVAKTILIDIDKYCKNCEILGIKVELEKMIVLRLAGVILAVIFLISGVCLQNIQFILLVIFPFIILSVMPLGDIRDKAQRKKALIIEELPRFLDMLETALYIGLPIEEAIRITALHLKGTALAKEFSETITEIQIGAISWQNALTKMSNKYEIDTFAEFVLDLVNAYEKGVYIYDTVCSENKRIKQAQIVEMKEVANKMHSTILFPILIFKLVPIIVLIGLPIVIQLLNFGF